MTLMTVVILLQRERHPSYVRGARNADRIVDQAEQDTEDVLIGGHVDRPAAQQMERGRRRATEQRVRPPLDDARHVECLSRHLCRFVTSSIRSEHMSPPSTGIAAQYSDCGGLTLERLRYRDVLLCYGCREPTGRRI